MRVWGCAMIRHAIALAIVFAALGTAVVEALLEAGAKCHVPYRGADAGRLSAFRGDVRVTLTSIESLTDESVVNGYYEGLTEIWASIHIAGGFESAAIEQFADKG